MYRFADPAVAFVAFELGILTANGIQKSVQGPQRFFLGNNSESFVASDLLDLLPAALEELTPGPQET